MSVPAVPARAVSARRDSAAITWQFAARWLSSHPDVVAVAAIALAATLIRASFSFRAPPFITNDSLSYLLPGWQLARGGPLDTIFKRPPGYSVFVAAALWVFGSQDVTGLLVLQHLAGVVTALLAFALGRLWAGRGAGVVAGALTALSGPLLVTEQYVMSETLFGLLVTAMHLGLLHALLRRSTRSLAIAGVLLGLAALTRPVAQIVLPLAVVAVVVAFPRWKAALRGALVIASMYAVTVLPWMVRNQVVQGSFSIAGGLGEGLAVRTIRLDQEFEFRAPPGEDRPRAERRIFREEAARDSVFDMARRLRDELRLSSAEADRAMRDIALGAIAQKPMYYVAGSLDMFARMLVGRPTRLRQDWTPWRGTRWDDRVQYLFPVPTAAEDHQFEQAQLVSSLFDPPRWSVLLGGLLFAGLGLAAVRRTWTVLLIAASALGMLLASAFLVGIEWRYRYPMDPTLCAIMGCGLVWLAAGVRAGGRLRRRP
ncbi:MAG: glycosyltransferase family 39 protein [Chloroflexi bacterium]|nr:glycosyltransferase family 39 protein [Chloroflexota bacterium]